MYYKAFGFDLTHALIKFGLSNQEEWDGREMWPLLKRRELHMWFRWGNLRERGKKGLLEIRRLRWEDNIKMDLQ